MCIWRGKENRDGNNPKDTTMDKHGAKAFLVYTNGQMSRDYKEMGERTPDFLSLGGSKGVLLA